MKVSLLALDIDGVLTDGRFALDASGNEYKCLSVRDLDAITLLRSRGLTVALVTGEDGPLVDTIARRLGVATAVKGAKNKGEALVCLAESLGTSLSEVCYVGDADRDAPALRLCGLPVVPADASRRARESAAVVLSVHGGYGVLSELADYLVANDCLPTASP